MTNWSTPAPRPVWTAIFDAIEAALTDPARCNTIISECRLDPDRLLATSVQVFGGLLVGPGAPDRFAQLRSAVLAQTSGDQQTVAQEMISAAQAWAGADISTRDAIIGGSPFDPLVRTAVACQLAAQVAESLAGDDAAELIADMRQRLPEGLGGAP